jgi:predicted ATPase
MAGNGTSQKERGITAIAVSGFKSLCDMCRIEVRPLTILAGANSSGKSSIMQPLLLLKQTLEASYDPGALRLDGPNVQFTEAGQFQSKLLGKARQDRLVIELEADGTKTLTTTFRIARGQNRQEIEVAEMAYDAEAQTFSLHPGMKSNKILPLVPDPFEQMRSDFKKETGIDLHWQVVRNRCFLVFSLCGEEDDENDNVWSDLFPPVSPSALFAQHISRMIYVPGLRGNPERFYRITPVTGPVFQGPFQNYVASVIYYWQNSRKAKFKELNEALNALGLTWKVHVEARADTEVELQVGRSVRSAVGGARDTVSIADVGYGISQVLPVIVALITAEPGQLVYLEQPELHLHPRAQMVLAEIIARAADRGVRVVVETHSALLLLGIQSLVAEGKLSPQKVKLHWFSRNDDGVTTIESADLDKSGAFGDWPEDFGAVELEAQDRYLTAVEERMMG